MKKDLQKWAAKGELDLLSDWNHFLGRRHLNEGREEEDRGKLAEKGPICIARAHGLIWGWERLGVEMFKNNDQSVKGHTKESVFSPTDTSCPVKSLKY